MVKKVGSEQDRVYAVMMFGQDFNRKEQCREEKSTLARFRIGL